MNDDEQITGCLLCGCAAVLKYKDLPGYQEPATFQIYHCLYCNTAFSLPRVEAAAVYENIYRSGKLVPGYDRYWKYMQAVKKSKTPLDYLAETEDIYWGVKEALTGLVKEKRSAKILEIGSGLGYLTYSLINAGYDVTGLDISQIAVMQAIKTFGDHYVCADLFEYATLHARLFDIVILTEVIEHIDRPLDFIESILKLLKPGGQAIVTTPNKSLFPSDIIWMTENPPVHCWWFSEDSMKFIAGKNQVKLRFVDFSRYYQQNYTRFNLKKYRLNPILKPTLDENGELIITTHKRSSLLTLPRLILTKMPRIKKKLVNIKNYFLQLKESSNPGIIICKNRGTVLCAIFEKNDSK